MYIDFASGVAVTSLGHCHPVLVSALTEQAGNALARLQLVHERARAATRQAADRRDVRRTRILLQLWRRGQRGGSEARASLCARPAWRREDARHRGGKRVPRSHAVHGDGGRAAEIRERIRAEPGRHHASALQRHCRARARVRCARSRYLCRDSGTDAGRRRDDARHARIPAGGAASVHVARRAADPRRDPERHGAHRRAVLVHAEGRRPRHPDKREGPGRRLSDRRDADHRPKSRASFRLACTAPRTAATRLRARSRAPCST